MKNYVDCKMKYLCLMKKLVRDCIYKKKKELSYMDGDVMELYVRLKRTIEIKIEFIRVPKVDRAD